MAKKTATEMTRGAKPARLWSVIGCAGVLYLAGCAENQAARNLARVMLGQEITYQAQLEQQIKQEQVFYKASAATLTDDVRRSMTMDERVIVSEESGAAVARVVRPGGRVVAADLTAFIQKTLQEVAAQRADALRAVARYDEQFPATIQKLDEQKATLLKIRKGLEQLQEQPTALDQTRDVFEFAKKVKEEADKAAPKAEAP